MITAYEVLDDLRQFGHYHAVDCVTNSIKRLEARARQRGKVVRHRASAEAADDPAGQVAKEARRAAL